MIKTNLLIIARFFLKNKLFCFINLFGLALGIACFSVVLLFVEFEFSYDKFHRDPGNVYRVVKDFVNNEGTRVPDANTPGALAPAMRNSLPEVESITRFMANGGRRNLLDYNDKRFYELNLLRIDSSFFRVFDFQFVKGSKDHPFKGIHSILLTETTARKYFGDEDPIGKTIRTNINNRTEFEVTAVLKDVPPNSHFSFDVLIPFESTRNPDTDWTRHVFYTYARLRSHADAGSLDVRIADIIKTHLPNSLDEYYVQPLTGIHLTSKLKGELSQNGDLQYVRILLVIGVFVLIIGSINYVNLVTAQSVRRAKEIGIKKSMGAVRGLLIKQFLLESLVMVVAASIFAMALTLILLPSTEQILGTDLSAFLFKSRSLWIMIPCSIFGIASLSGIYPALYLSSFHPIKVLKGGRINSFSGIGLRQALVIFQFVMSSTMIIGFMVISRQIEFIRHRHLGFDEQNVLMVPNVIGVENPEAVAEDFKKLASVERVGRASGGFFGSRNSVNGVADAQGNNHTSLNFMRVDYDYIPTLRMEMKEGRNFSREFISDSTAIIINETALSQLGLKQPAIGQQLNWDDDAGKTHRVTIVGVARDFHFTSFHESIKPFGFILEVDNGSTFFLRINSINLSATLADVEEVWKRHSPDKPFDYAFQEEQMARLHLSEERFKGLFTAFTILAITISCLGLFGLITAVSESKTKEIGIRKVLGSSVAGIVGLLTKEFMKLVALALVVAMPLAFFLTESWLQEFVYRIDITWPVFLLGIATTFTIAFLTICVQSVKAAMANPVKSLRSE